MNRFNQSRNRLIEELEYLQQDYQQSQPCSHLVIDDLFLPEILEEVRQEFALKNHHNLANSEIPQNSQIKSRKVRELSDLTRTFYFWLNSHDFIQALTLAVGCDRHSLIGDPDLYGAGIHEILPGDKLESNQNIVMHTRLPLLCRFNLIICLNHQSNTDWAGSLEIYNCQTQTKHIIYRLQFNRTFILPLTNKVKYKIATSDRSRNSSKFLSIYYWSLVAD